MKNGRTTGWRASVLFRARPEPRIFAAREDCRIQLYSAPAAQGRTENQKAKGKRQKAKMKNGGEAHWGLGGGRDECIVRRWVSDPADTQRGAKDRKGAAI
jgi:hypothetical protein